MDAFFVEEVPLVLGVSVAASKAAVNVWLCVGSSSQMKRKQATLWLLNQDVCILLCVRVYMYTYIYKIYKIYKIYEMYKVTVLFLKNCPAKK